MKRVTTGEEETAEKGTSVEGTVVKGMAVEVAMEAMSRKKMMKTRRT